MSMIKSMIRYFSGSGRKGRLLILAYHRVRRFKDPVWPWDPDSREFAAQMRLLSKHFNPLTVCQAIRRIDDGSLPERSICVTFDDGYADNLLVAAPILERTGVRATFFVSTGYLNGGMMWNDRIIDAFRQLEPGEYDFEELGKIDLRPGVERSEAALATVKKLRYMEMSERDRISTNIIRRHKIKAADETMMTDAMVEDLHTRQMEVGAHTVSHPILASLDEAAARAEISDSKSYLESLLRSEVTSFAYPNGRMDQDITFRDIAIVRSLGFEAAVTTHWGATTGKSDRWALPRVGVSGQSEAKTILRLCKAYRSEMDIVTEGVGR